MLIHIRNLFIILLFTAPLVFPQIIKSVHFSGGREFNEAEYITWSASLGAKYFPSAGDSIQSKISYQLGLRGYFNPEFKNYKYTFSGDSSSVTLSMNINEGKPTYINSVSIDGDDSVLTTQLITSFHFLKGSVYNKAGIEETISETLLHLENTGYPFGKVIITSAYIYTDSLTDEHYANLHFKISRETQSKIDKVKIEGNKTTKDYVIIRELRLEPGEKYSQKKIEELPERLNRLRFFDPVGVPDFYINKANEGVLLIKVKEKQTNNFDGILGYIPARNENEKGYLTGLVNVTLMNLFGTGRAAAIRWQQLDRNSQELELHYLEPWLLGYPFNVSGRLFQRKQDSTYVQRNFEGTLEYLATENISASVFVSTEAVIPTLRVDDIFTVYHSNSLTTGVNFKIDTRDDPYAPLGGIYFINSYSLSRKKIYGPPEFLTPDLETNIKLQRIALDISGYYELFNRQVVALGLHGRELQGSFFEISDLYHLGGTNTLRGYREDQFLGSRIFWSNLEYRLLLTRRSFAFLFLDTGYYLRNPETEKNILKQEDFKIGYGIGLNIETGLGILGVSFGLAKGSSFTDGLIHFGIVNEF